MRSSKPVQRSRLNPDDLDRELDILAQLMDTMFRVPGLGWRFGLDPIIGLIPVVGDLVATLVSLRGVMPEKTKAVAREVIAKVVAALVSLYIILAALRYGVSKVTVVRMGLNVGIDLLLGSLPFVGDVFDVWWKANQRNVRLLRQRVRVAGRHGADASDWLFVGLVLAVLLALLLAGLALLGWVVGQLIGAISA